MLKAADNVAMKQEDSASQNGEMTSWDINDIKLPQVCVCILEIYPILIGLLHFRTLSFIYASLHLCSLSPWAIGLRFAWRAREYPVIWSFYPFLVPLPKNHTHVLHGKPVTPHASNLMTPQCHLQRHLSMYVPDSACQAVLPSSSVLHLPTQPSYLISVSSMLSHCCSPKASMSRATSFPKVTFTCIQPGGFLHTFLYALKWGCSAVSIFKVHILTAIMALSGWEQQF